MDGKESKNFSNKFKVFIIITTIILLVVLTVYWLILAPAISPLFYSDNDISHGIEYYNNGEFLTYEDGKAFKTMIDYCGAIEKGEIIDFYYVDTHVEDNPFYGKMCDIYSLDIQMTPEEYTKEKNEFTYNHNSMNGTYLGNYVCYPLKYSELFDDKIVVVSFCDYENIVRYTMITECNSTDGFDGILILHSSLEW